MKSRSDYEFELWTLRNEIERDPHNREEYQKKIERILPRWMETLPVTVFVANNEQTPWDIESIGFSPCPMPQKNEAVPQQVGDYQYWIETPGKSALECFGPLLVERKSLPDFYGTMYGERERFYREVDRFKADPRFNQMLVVIEAEIGDWYEYQPTALGDNDENTRTRTVTLEGKQATIASLLARGVIPVFAGSRELAPRLYRNLVRQNIIKNYERWLLRKVLA